jgi:fatty-acyl-CoA synthase
VIGTPDDKWGEAVTAVVALKPDARLTEAELIEWARGRLAGFKCPRLVAFVN